MKLLNILSLFLIFVIIPFALAEETATETPTDTSMDYLNANGWLLNNVEAVAWDKPINEVVFSLLALNNQGGYEDNVTIGLTKLLTKLSTTGCFPKNACTVTDTALGLIALGKTGQETNKTITWLKNSEIASGAKPGKWLIQLGSNVDGNCQITCEDGSVKTVAVGPTKSWIDASTLCGAIGNKKSKKYDVYCGDVGDTNLHISLLYQIVTSSYIETFLLHDEQTQKTTLVLENACFPKTQGATTCDYESTLYATWALKSIADEDVSTLSYLEESKDVNTLHRALLYLVVPESKAYSTWLTSHQKPSGSWSDDVYITSIASLAMIDQTESYLNATNWLKLKYNAKKTNWNDKVLDTASALIALSGEIRESSIDLTPGGEVVVPNETAIVELICNDGLDNDNDNFTDCKDSDCSLDSACLCSTTKGDECGSSSDCSEGKTCNTLTCKCETSNVIEGCSKSNGDQCESNLDCNEGEECNTFSCICEEAIGGTTYEVCDNKIDDNGDGLVDCKDSECVNDDTCAKGSMWPWIIIILIALALLGLLGYYYINYVKKGKTFKDFVADIKGAFSGKKKNKKPSFEEYAASRQLPTMMQPRTQVKQQLPSYQVNPTKTVKEKKIEDELEKSLEEAKKLLGK